MVAGDSGAPRPQLPEGSLTHASPNFGPRRNGLSPTIVVIHYTGMASTELALERLRDPETEVSAHYVISMSGRVLSMVPEVMRAWHAGAGTWGGLSDINSRSIGIELANPGPEACHPPFPHPQMNSLERLLAAIIGRWNIHPARVIGHADMAPGRKADPGPKFDWRRLAAAGLSVWPEAGSDSGPARAATPTGWKHFRTAASSFGYAPPSNDEAGWRTVLQVFRTRFRTGDLSGSGLDRPTNRDVRAACALAEACPASGIDPGSAGA